MTDDTIKILIVYFEIGSKILLMKWSRHKRRRVSGDTPRRVLLRQIFWGIVSILLVSGIGYGIWYFTHLPSLNISEVVVSGGETLPHDEIQLVTEDELIGDYVRLIPKSFVWTYPEESISDSLYEIDRVKDVDIQRDNQQLSVHFEEYQPVALWCSPDDLDCVFLDSAGYAFAEAPKLEGSAFVRYSEVGRQPTKRTVGFPAEFIQNTNEFIVRAYDQLGFNIIAVEKTGLEEMIYHVAGGGEIKVSTRVSTEETLANLATILSSSEFSHLSPGNFQYVDLRYGDKVFVNETISENTETTTSTSDADVVEDMSQ